MVINELNCTVINWKKCEKRYNSTHHKIEMFSPITPCPCSAAPRLAGGSVNTKSVQLNWGASTAAGRAAQRGSGNAIMTEWSNSGPADNGVNVRLCFSRHDKDGNGCIDSFELKRLLKVSKLFLHVNIFFPSLHVLCLSCNPFKKCKKIPSNS